MLPQYLESIPSLVGCQRSNLSIASVYYNVKVEMARNPSRAKLHRAGSFLAFQQVIHLSSARVGAEPSIIQVSLALPSAAALSSSYLKVISFQLHTNMGLEKIIEIENCFMRLT